MLKQPIILASSSKARRTLLARLRLPFEVVSPDIDESELPGETPEALVQRLAKQKAEKVATRHTQGLIIASDQVAIINGKIAGKPLNHQNAVEQLISVSDKICRFVNGLCLLNAQTQRVQLALVEFSVKFKPLSLTTIEAYLAKEAPYECAGSIKSEGLAIALFEAMLGDDPTALEGLPLITLTQFLANEGVTVI